MTNEINLTEIIILKQNSSLRFFWSKVKLTNWIPNQSPRRSSVGNDKGESIMKRSFLFTLIILMGFLFNPSFAQTGDSSAVQFEFQSGLAKFSFDGKFDNGDFGFGIMYYTPSAIVEPGIFLTTNIDFNAKNNDEVLFMGLLGQVQFKRTFSIGVYYDFWQTDVGIIGWGKTNAGFTVSYNFDI